MDCSEYSKTVRISISSLCLYGIIHGFYSPFITLDYGEYFEYKILFSKNFKKYLINQFNHSNLS